MRSGVQQPMMMPNPEQQKAMMLMGLTQMKSRFANEPDLAGRLQEIEEGLNGGTMELDTAKMMMGQVQGLIMQKMMVAQQQSG